MGRRTSGNIEINVNRVFDVADDFGLPVPKANDPEHDWVVELTASECRQYCKTADNLYKMSTKGYLLNNIQLQLILISYVFESQMQEFINKVRQEADEKKLAGRPRLAFFRAESKKFRVSFW